jgi:hypothetical protein
MLRKLDHNPGGFLAPPATTNKNLVTRPTGAKSILLQSNSPMGAQKSNIFQANHDFSYNFDIQSNKSAPFAKEENMEEIERQLQDKIQEVYTNFEGKQDKLQKTYQDKLE